MNTELTLHSMFSTGLEGRAGMAAVIIRPGLMFDGKKLFEHVVRDLPAYAYPRFIRIQVMSRAMLHLDFVLIYYDYNSSFIMTINRFVHPPPPNPPTPNAHTAHLVLTLGLLSVWSFTNLLALNVQHTQNIFSLNLTLTVMITCPAKLVINHLR